MCLTNKLPSYFVDKISILMAVIKGLYNFYSKLFNILENDQFSPIEIFNNS